MNKQHERSRKPIRPPKRFNGPLSRGPEPRLPIKHEFNPPIVTILGAGVAGLTAAHELVERGFLVQVVEAVEDPRHPGRPHVGGMAANQAARVRANIEDLHAELFNVDAAKQHVANWLLTLFAFNRTRWLATERPAVIEPILQDAPQNELGKKVVEALGNARRQYRERWLWDLVFRSVCIEDVKARDYPQPHLLLQRAHRVHERLMAMTETEQLASELIALKKSDKYPGDDLAPHRTMIAAALEREFLCFRLVPRSLRGFEDAAPRHARQLYKQWTDFLKQTPLQHNTLCPERVPIVPTEELPARAKPELECWLELQIIEQRLPGEHGFRFFPSFYRHLDDTMRRIPLYRGHEPTGWSVIDNLRPTVFQGIGFNQKDREELRSNGRCHDWNDDDRRAAHNPNTGSVTELKRSLPRSLEGLRDRTDRFVKRIGGTKRDALLLFAKLVRFMTSSPERRRANYEGTSWNEFLDIGKFSDPMQKLIKTAATALVGFSTSEACARTYGNSALQLLLDQLKDTSRVDRTLNGPTSDSWLEPWREYLERQGVRFFCRSVDKLQWEGEELVPTFVSKEGAGADADILSESGYGLLTHQHPPGLRPDFYVLALNFEETHRLLDGLGSESAHSGSSSEANAPDFARTLAFWDQVVAANGLKHATGVQFFFDAKTSLGQGHMYFPLAPWGLSSISQSEFWLRRGGFADGYSGVLSVGVFDPGEPGPERQGSLWQVLTGKKGPWGTHDPLLNQFELARQIWQNVKDRISTNDELSEPRCYHIDQMLLNEAEALRGGQTPKSFSHFLASIKGVERARPGRDEGRRQATGPDEIRYAVNHRRWVLCSTFMATHTRLTTMEAANESARHAVRAILLQIAENRQQSSGHADAMIDGEPASIRDLENATYNGARQFYDLPDIFNPEEHELEDLDVFRRIDRRLVALDMPHFMDILDLDRKLEHALQTIEIYGDTTGVDDWIGGFASGLDALLLKELGHHYQSPIRERAAQSERTRAARQEAAAATHFEELASLFEDIGKLGR